MEEGKGDVGVAGTSGDEVALSVDASDVSMYSCCRPASLFFRQDFFGMKFLKMSSSSSSTTLVLSAGDDDECVEFIEDESDKADMLPVLPVTIFPSFDVGVLGSEDICDSLSDAEFAVLAKSPLVAKLLKPLSFSVLLTFRLSELFTGIWLVFISTTRLL